MAVYIPIPGVDWRVLTVDGSGNPISASNPLPTSAVAGTSGGVVSTVNSTVTPLTNGATFTGTGEDVSGYALITVAIFADQIPAASGIKLQFSKDNTNWDVIADFAGMDFGATGISVGHTYKIVPAAQFFRLVYVNGATPQTVFRVQTVYHSGGVPEVNRILDSTSGIFSYIRSSNSLPQGFAGGTQPAYVTAIRNGAATHDINLTAKAANTNADGVGVPAAGVMSTSDAGTTWKALKGNTDGSLPVGGFTPAAPTATFTRGANQTPYTIGDEVGTAGTAPTTVAVGRFNGASGVIQGATLVYSNYPAIVPALTVLLFSATVTLAGDNAQLALSDGDANLLIGIIPLTQSQAGFYSAGTPTSSGNQILSGVPTCPIHFVCGGGTTNIFAALITTAAFTPIANSETAQLTLQVEQN